MDAIITFTTILISTVATFICFTNMFLYYSRKMYVGDRGAIITMIISCFPYVNLIALAGFSFMWLTLYFIDSFKTYGSVRK